MPRLLLLLTVLLNITGCQSAPIRDESSPRFKVPAGSTVILHRLLQTDPGSARAYIQFGQPIPFAQTRQRYPRCYFYLDTVSEQAQTIEPDEFEVVKTQQLRRISALEDGQLLASVGFGFGFGDGGSDENFATHLQLRSARQSQVSELICELLTTTADVMRDFLSIKEIRATLGEVVTLQLAEPAAQLPPVGAKFAPVSGRYYSLAIKTPIQNGIPALRAAHTVP
jgi:hypothetical protein